MPEIDQPDPFEIMEAEVEYNRYDTENPYGITQWTRDPGTKRFKQTVTLNPEYEALRKQQVERQNRGLVMNPFAALNDAAPGVGRIMSGAMQRVGERYDGQVPGNKPPAFNPSQIQAQPQPNAAQYVANPAPAGNLTPGGPGAGYDPRYPFRGGVNQQMS